MLVVSIWIERQYEVQATHVFEEVPQDRAAITTIMALKTLAKHVETQLGERAVCVVFEHDLERCWPRKEMTQAKRQREIQSFAVSQGWTAAIVEVGFGMRAVFRRMEAS